jgi:predicted dehydrogenase
MGSLENHMTKRIKAGLIGAGFIGPAHLEAVRRLGFIDVIAISELNQDLADSKARQLNIPKAYGDYHDLLADKEIEVVHNCTPNYMHYAVSKSAIEAGKSIISEKPLAMTSKESAELVELARKEGVLNAINFVYRYYPLVQQMRGMISQGQLGKIYLAHGCYLQDWLLFDTDYNWRIEPDIGGKSRAVADIGSHWCDLIQFVTGLKITEVMADLKVAIPTRKKSRVTVDTFAGNRSEHDDYELKTIVTEDYGAILLTFENGAKGTFLVSQISAGRKNMLLIEVDGSKSAVAWNQEEPNELWIGKRDSPNHLLVKDPSLLISEAKGFADYPGGHPEGYADALKMLMKNVYTSIINKSEDRRVPADFPTFEDGHREMLIADSIVRSHETRRWIGVEYP